MITKQDLAAWNSNPVTIAIFKEINKAVIELKQESIIKETCDQTAMQASRNEGVIEGVKYLKDAYEQLEDEDNE